MKGGKSCIKNKRSLGARTAVRRADGRISEPLAVGVCLFVCGADDRARPDTCFHSWLTEGSPEEGSHPGDTRMEWVTAWSV